MQHVPILKDIVLVGGGHTHTLVVKKWGMKPLPGVRLTLVSRDVLTPYSGMLPGFIAGHYTREETHIDLAYLCRWAGVRFVEATVNGFDLNAQQVLLGGRPAIEYDVLSVNTGSTPDIDTVPGARDYTVPVKPVHRFEEKWVALQQRMDTPDNSTQKLSVGVVGAGVGGFELLTSLDEALKTLHPQRSTDMHWFVRSDRPLQQQPQGVADAALSECSRRDITAHLNFDVAKVDAEGVSDASGSTIKLDEVLWVTAARAPEWPGQSGLATDDRGFIKVTPSLQSVSHSNVFAAGDIASLPGKGVAKAGVFAVRQAPVLFANLRRAVAGENENLQQYHPQKNFLTLISVGRQSAIASRNGIVIKGDWVWRWKDWIDKGFMQKFRDLPERTMNPPQVRDIPPALLKNSTANSTDLKFCGGCGAKVGGDVLAEVLEQLQGDKQMSPANRVGATAQKAGDSVLLSGISEDVCIVDPGNRLLVQSVDQLRASFDDNYLLGRVAALHALSDVFAAGANADTALAIATLPFADDVIQRRDLTALMTGAVEELNRAGCTLSGGHTGIGPELMLGFTVNGFIDAVTLQAQPDSAAAGDAIVLSKPLGSGVIMAADMRGRASGFTVKGAMDTMLTSNQEATLVFDRFGASARTDVTGFGLLGHLANLLQRLQEQGRKSGNNSNAYSGDQWQAKLSLNKIPLLPGSVELAAGGIRSSLYAANARLLAQYVAGDSSDNEQGGSANDSQYRRELLLDPQTNGGLLAIVPAANAEECVEQLLEFSPQAAIIGSIAPGANDGKLFSETDSYN